MLLPAVVSVLGRWNWWMPVWAARILRVEPCLPPPERRGAVPLDLESPTQAAAAGTSPGESVLQE